MIFSKIKRHILVILLFIVITLVVTYPLVGHLDNWVHNGADSYFIAWTLAWDVHAFENDISNIFNANIFYPNDNTLAYSEHIIGTAILAWPIIAITSNPILAYNILTLLFFVLAAYCMYLFMYYLTKNSAISIISAIIFGFNPFRVIHFSQIHLQVIFFFPLILLLLHRLFSKRRNRDFLYFIITYVALGYMSSHYFLMISIIVALFAGLYFFTFDKSRPKKEFIIKFIVSLIMVFLAILPVFYPYLVAHDESGYARSYSLIDYYSPNIDDYLIFSPLIENTSIRNSIEEICYTGFTIIILFLISIFTIIKKRAQDQKLINSTAIYLVIGIVFFALSLGVIINFSDGDTGMVGPYMILYKLVPGFDGLRSLGRFFVGVLLAISTIIGLGLNQFLKRIKNRKIYLAVGVLVSSLLVLEYLWVPLFQPVSYYEVKTGDKIPEVYHWLAEEEGDSVILELPLDYDIMKAAEYVYMSSYHWKKMFNGYSGFYPESFLELENDISNRFTDSETQMRISEYGINYVIVHFDVKSEFILGTSPEELTDLPSLELIEQFGNDYVYEVVE